MNEWISVKDHLPAVGTPVLMFRNGRIQLLPFWSSDALDGEVTHWMPLPEPPK